MTRRGLLTSARCALGLCLAASVLPSLSGASGTEGASFLDIPVGGRPAALGGAYSALATDAYAPVWNAAGLGFLPSTQLSGMHVEYPASSAYEFASLVHPLGSGNGLGFAAQYFHLDQSTGRDANGNDIGSFTSHYGAYSLSFGHSFNKEFSLGAAVKLIDARIADVSARAVAADFGALYRPTERLAIAAVAANLGSKLTFLEQGDRLPQNYRLGAVYGLAKAVDVAAETAYDQTTLLSGRFGVEWRPAAALALRAGYRTETTSRLSAEAGLTTGFGLTVAGQRFDYAWLPLGDLGQTQYFSVVLSFGKGAK